MRPLLAAAALLLACVVSASRLETVFSVSMPYALSYIGGAYVFRDGLYVTAGFNSSGVIEAVNLTTRSNIWVSSNLSAYGYINTVAISASAILVQIGSNIAALSTKTGQLMWVQSGGYELQYSGTPAAFSYGDTIYAQVSLPSGPFALQAFDLATGAPGYFQYGNTLTIDGNTAFIAEYGLISGVTMVNPQLRAVDIPTNTTLWTVRATDNSAGGLISAVNSEYVAFSNFSEGDEIAVVLHRGNGSVAHAFQAFNGFQGYGSAALHGHMLFALIGAEYERYVLVDLRTGYTVWTRSAGELGNSGVFCGGAVVTISYGLVLSITPVWSGRSPVSVPHVPSLPSPTIADFGYGVVQVGNLQGYTLWDTATGTVVASNQQDPNAAMIAPLKWNGLFIMVSGDVVSAMTVVS